MMLRCVELSRIAVAKGEYPFGTVIAHDGQIVAEAINRTIRQSDISRHAEIIALAEAQKAFGRERLRHCTLYTNIEPCAMCSYCIREAWVGRVVYARLTGNGWVIEMVRAASVNRPCTCRHGTSYPMVTDVCRISPWYAPACCSS